MKLIRQSAFITSILALIIFIACKRTIGGIDRDTPPLPSGNQYIAIDIATTDGSALPTYTVLVTAPDGSTSSSTSTDAQFVIDPITSGNYSITVDTEAGTHIGQTKEIAVNVPAEASDDYIIGDVFLLTEKNPPVPVDHEVGATITVPAMGTGAGGLGSSPTTVTIPAGALEGIGVTDISITPVPTSGGSTSNGLKGVEFHFEPDGTTFTEPITLNMPLGLSQNAVNNGASLLFEYEGGETQPITLSGNGSTGTTQIDHFSTWTIILQAATLEVSSSTDNKGYFSECGEGLDETFSFSGTIGPVVANIFQVPAAYQTITINGTVFKEPIQYYYIEANAQAFTYNYRLLQSGTVIEQRNKIPLCKSCYTVKYSSSECHDSGG